MPSRMRTAPATSTTGPPSPLLGWALLGVDLALILLFAALGNRSHDTGLGITDVLGTAAPFLLAWTAAALLMRTLRRPSRLLPDGLIIWAVTIAGGMVLRVLMGLGGAPLSFVTVAATTLGVLLLGRRLLTGMLAPATRG